MTRQAVPPRLPALPLALAFASGLSSLCFEVLWTRWISVEAGEPLAAFALAVTATLGGAAAGAMLFGRLADRASDPLRLFGLAQVGAGAVGVAAAAARWGGLLRAGLAVLPVEPGGLGFLAAEAAMASPALIVPAALMGGTLPLLIGTGRDPSDAGRLYGLLGAASAAGGAAGALVCGFVMLPSIGLTTGLLAASALAGVTGATALLAPRRGPRRSPDGPPAGAAPAGRAPEEDAARGTGRRSPPLVLGCLAAGGLALTSLEVVWTRVGALCMGSSVQAASLVLASVIAGLSIGSALASRRTQRPLALGCRPGPLALLASATLLATEPILGLLPLVQASLARWGYESSSPAAVAEALRALPLAVLVALPCLPLGALLPAGFLALRPGAARRRGEGRRAGAASAALSSGNMLGAPASLLAMGFGLTSRGCLLGSAALLALAALAAGGGRRVRATGGLLVGLSAGAATLGGWDPAVLSSGPYLYGHLYGMAAAATGERVAEAVRRRGAVVFWRDGPHALVTVRRHADGTLSMQVDGKTDASTGGDLRTQVLLGQLPLLVRDLRAGEGSILVVGLGSGVTLGSALTHPVREATVVEIAPEVVEASRHFREASGSALEDPRVRLIVGDARARLLFEDRRYDVIISQPSNPWISGQAALFTREYFDQARRRLLPGGIMAQWLQAYGLRVEEFRSVMATFASAFPCVTVWEESTAGGDYLLLGSGVCPDLDPARIAIAWSPPAVRADLERVEMEAPAALLAQLVMDDGRVRRFVEGVALQSEESLALEFAARRSLRLDTLGAVMASLEPHRLRPASLAALIAPRDDRLAVDLARRARQSGREREWAMGLGLTRSFGPSDPSLLRALSFLKAGMRRHALEAVLEASRHRPSDRFPHLLLAHLSMSLGLVAEAVAELGRAAALDPDDARTRLYLARALFSAGDLPAALAQNAESIRLDPSLAETFNDRCGMLVSADDLPSAEAACREALDLDPSLAPAHANIGLLHARRGRLSEAEASYRRALDLEPELTDARYNLALLLERTGRPEGGLEVLRPALQAAFGPAAEDYRLAAELARAAGDAEAASAYQREAGRRESGGESPDVTIGPAAR